MVVHAKQGFKEMAYQAANPFGSREIRNWFFGLEQVEDYFPVHVVATLGSHPFEKTEFDEFLLNLGFDVQSVSTDTSHLVLGHSGWSETELLDLLRWRSGKELRVYSQEMFLGYFMTWIDPLEGSEELLEEFSQGHAGLGFLKNVGFDWPSVRVVPNNSSKDSNSLDLDVPRKGLLHFMGYRVGKTSTLTTVERRAILDNVFKNEIRIGGLSPHYIAEWGQPRSRQRLEKIANSIAAFSRNAQKRRNPSMSQAVADWEDDLQYLWQRYYVPLGFQFQWPYTEV